MMAATAAASVLPAGSASLVVLASWTAILWLLGFTGFLVVRPLLRGWADQGYGLAKVLGPFLLGAGVWVAGSLGARVDGRTAAIVVGLLVLAAALTTWQTRGNAWPSMRTCLRVDALFLFTLGAAACVRAWSPTIIGTERPMDHALLAAVLGQARIPPADPWLAGYVVNYHHAGHAWWAATAALAGYPPWIAYNLIVATLPAQIACAAWSVGSRVRTAYGWIAVATIVAAGSWAPVASLVSTGQRPTMVNATRVVPGTINEFPLFSLTWGDLHGHVLALPLLVTIVGLLIRLHEIGDDNRERSVRVPIVVTLAMLATAATLTSTWDTLPMLVAALWTVVLMRRWPLTDIVAAAVAGAATLALLAWPAVTTVDPPAMRWGVEPDGSPLGALTLVLATWFAPFAMLLPLTGPRRPLLTMAWVVGITCALFWSPWGVRLIIVVLMGQVYLTRGRLGDAPTAIALSALALVLIAECVWVDDVYGWHFRRVNTVFKWHLHAMVLAALALPAVVHVLWTSGTRWTQMATRCALSGLACVAGLSSLLTVGMLWSRREPVRGFDGLAGIAQRHPGDADAIRHVWTTAPRDAVIAEASDDAYSYAGRIATLTGRQSLLGWSAHEALWRRGTAWEAVIEHRRGVLSGIYTGDPAAVGHLVREADVHFIVVSEMERRRYSELDSSRFAPIADLVVNSHGTEVWRVR